MKIKEKFIKLHVKMRSLVIFKSPYSRILFSSVVTALALGTIYDAYPDLDFLLLGFIGFLVFNLVNTATKFVPIEDIKF